MITKSIHHLAMIDEAHRKRTEKLWNPEFVQLIHRELDLTCNKPLEYKCSDDGKNKTLEDYI